MLRSFNHIIRSTTMSNDTQETQSEKDPGMKSKTDDEGKRSVQKEKTELDITPETDNTGPRKVHFEYSSKYFLKVHQTIEYPDGRIEPYDDSFQYTETEMQEGIEAWEAEYRRIDDPFDIVPAWPEGIPRPPTPPTPPGRRSIVGPAQQIRRDERMARRRAESEKAKQGADDEDIEEEEEEGGEGDSGEEEEESEGEEMRKYNEEGDIEDETNHTGNHHRTNLHRRTTIAQPYIDPLQRTNPRLHNPLRSRITSNERKLISAYLLIQLDNPDTHSADRIKRSKAVIYNLRTLMAQVTASGERCDDLTKRRLLNIEWGGAIWEAREVLSEEGVEVPEWEGEEYEDFLGLG